MNGAHLDIRVPQNASYVSITGAATGPYSVNIDPVPSSLVNGNRTFHPFGISTPGYDYIPLFIADLDPHERYDITLTYLGADEDYLIYDEMESIVYNFSKEIKAAKSRKQKINIAIGCSVAAVSNYQGHADDLGRPHSLGTVLLPQEERVRSC